MEVDKLIDYFRLHQDHPRQVHLLAGDEDTAKLVRLMMTECADVDIKVYCCDSKVAESMKEEQDSKAAYPGNKLEIKDFGAINEMSGEIGVLMFDEQIETETIMALANRKPRALVGLMKGTNVSYLHLWEKYKEFCDSVYLRYYYINGKVEVFNWDKGDDDVELSIIFPVYKVEKYLDQCISTVTAWKAPYVEFLFVNDGSPDNSREIILKYAEQDPRIKLIDKENGGCASARQKGLECARGRYVGFVDPDDFVAPDMFRQLLGRAMLGSYEVCYCGYNEYYDSNKRTKQIPDTLGGAYGWGTCNKDEIQKLLMYLRVAIWRGIYRRDMLTRSKISFCTELRRFDDLPFMIEVFAQAKSVVAIQQYLYYYRLDRPGQDVSCTDERLYVHFPIFAHVDEVFDRIDDQKLRDYLQCRKIMTHSYALQKLEEKYVDEYARRAREDFKKDAGMMRTLLCLKRWFGGTGTRAYLSVMFGQAKAYKRKLMKKQKKG